MKKYYYLLCGLFLLASCRMGHHHGTDVVIKKSVKNGLIFYSTSIESDTLSMLVAYAGKISFNKEHDAITGMSPKGYFKYKKNDRSLFVEREDGELRYEMADGRTEVRSEQERRKLITEAYQAVKYTDSLRNPPKKDSLAHR